MLRGGLTMIRGDGDGVEPAFTSPTWAVAHADRRNTREITRDGQPVTVVDQVATASGKGTQMDAISPTLSQPPDDVGEPLELAPIVPEGVQLTRETWPRLREKLRERWAEVIGRPSFGEYDHDPEVVRTFTTDRFRGTILLQPTGPDSRQQVLLMEPIDRQVTPRPLAVVPFYHPDTMAGLDLETLEPSTDRPLVQFGRHLVEQGYVVACTEAFPYNTVPEPESNAGFAWWQAAADRLLFENPQWTGIGKLVHDTSRAVDLLLDQPNVDADRVLAIGHSLGGKMAFYTAALDERITAVIASDFGIGWSFTNWDAPWYFGEQVNAEDFKLNGHHALALIAPRSFLMIAGEADRPASWQFIERAKPIYRLYDRENAVGCFMHMTGHQPTRDSIATAYRWLAEQFDLPQPSGSLNV